jgi:hypothetical protein
VRLKYVLGTLLLGFIAMSFLVALAAYSPVQPSQFNFYETIASFMFWFSAVSLALFFPLGGVTTLFIRYFRTFRAKLLFGSYISVHLVLYGFLLELMLDKIYKFPQIAFQPTLYFSSTVLYPVSLSSIITSFGFYPSVSILIPPSFDLALSLFSFSLALIIAILIVTNAMQVIDLGYVYAHAQKAQAFVLLPTLGVIAGASCCLSFPALISIAAPNIASFSNSATIFFVAYFAFPITTAIGLKYNLDSIRRMASDIERLRDSLLSSALESSRSR